MPSSAGLPDLGSGVEGGVLAEVQLVQIAELVERDDIPVTSTKGGIKALLRGRAAGSSPVGWWPAVAASKRIVPRVVTKALPRPETLTKFQQGGNSCRYSAEDCDLNHLQPSGEMDHWRYAASGVRCAVDTVPEERLPQTRNCLPEIADTDSEPHGSFFEYQAKELFAKHNVPPPRPGDRIPCGRQGHRRGDRPAGHGQGTGQGWWPRQGRWREVRRHRRGRLHPRQEHPRARHQGPHRQEAAGRRGQRYRRGVLHLLPARPRQPHLPGDVLGGGRHGDRGGGRHQAGAAGQGPRRRRSRASTWPSPARSPSRATCPPRCWTQPR